MYITFLFKSLSWPLIVWDTRYTYSLVPGRLACEFLCVKKYVFVGRSQRDFSGTKKLLINLWHYGNGLACEACVGV